jgi:hypothetical protein
LAERLLSASFFNAEIQNKKTPALISGRVLSSSLLMALFPFYIKINKRD